MQNAGCAPFFIQERECKDYNKKMERKKSKYVIGWYFVIGGWYQREDTDMKLPEMMKVEKAQ